MPARRTPIFEATEDDKWEQLFQKAIEAIDLFGERPPPDLLSGFVDALKARDFAGQRRSLNTSADLRGEEPRAAAGLGQTALRQRKA
jgi:hypothetical protein